ncbi:MAG: sigma 54-interacting transcriptional regulator [Peptococcaceae bacterium]|nr:sigma 54-interacting transcriptional regulator [Peptococcaceae bacterium]
MAILDELLQRFLTKTEGRPVQVDPVIGAMLNKLLNTDNSGWAIYDRELRFLYISGQDLVIRGVREPPERFIGMSMSQFLADYMWHTDWKKIEDDGAYLVARVKRSKACLTTLNHLPNGSQYLSTAIPFLDNDGEVLFIITIVHNLIDIKQYHDETEQFLKNIHAENLINPFSIPASRQTREMTDLNRKVSMISDTDVTVLITGESGTGKTVMANYIHSVSPRQDKPFVHINCSSIPESLIESELFGYENGSFSGAKPGGKIGLIEAANEGTIFLDEIGDMPLTMQTKLLVFLQENYFYKLGGTKRVKADVRVIAATNANLQEKIKSRQFREDLFYRLNIMPIEIPPLRKRQREILTLASTFLEKYNKKYKKTRFFAFTAQYPFLMYKWPGNIRELQHHIERLVITAESDQISSEMVYQDILTNCGHSQLTEETNSPGQSAPNSMKEALGNYEREFLLSCVGQFSSNRQIAKVLGISHTSVANKLRQYNINPQWKKKEKAGGPAAK